MLAPHARSRAFLEALAELIAPTRCAGCELPGVLVCDACMATIARIDPSSACARCGAPYAPGSLAQRERGSPCRECADRAYAFSAARAYGSLAHPLSRLVSVHKDGGEQRLATPLADMLGEAAADWLPWADAIVPLPASPGGERRRGRDHMLDIARLLAQEHRIPHAQLLQRIGGADQRRLGREDRSANLLATLKLRPSGSIPPRVLLLDDVFTTGATAHAAATLLLAEGALEVRFVAIARAFSP